MMLETICARYLPTFLDFFKCFIFNHITKIEEISIVNIFYLILIYLTFLRTGKFDKMCFPKNKIYTLRFLRLAHL